LIIVFACDKKETEVSLLNTLEINPGDNLVLELGSSVSFTVVGRDQKGQVITVTPHWSLEGDIGTLDVNSGEATVFSATKAGTVSIVATADNIFTRVEIEVVDKKVEHINITPTEAEVIIGGTIRLTAEGRDSADNIININPVWSLDNNLGTLNKKTGEEVVFTGISTGTCTVTVDYNGFKETVIINVVDLPEGEYAKVSGYVTNGRGGPAVQGVNITNGSYFTSTNEEGYFSIPIPAEEKQDLVLSKPGYGNVQVQNFVLNVGEEINLELPIRKVFHPEYSLKPPVISVFNNDTGEELKRGEVLSGVTNLEISIESEDNYIYVYYIYLGGEQRYPVADYDEEESGIVFSIDTGLYPVGKTYLRILAYDNNGNTTLYIIPVEIEKVNEPVPEKIEYLELYSYTFGQNIEYYSQGRGHLFDKMNINKNSAMIELSTGRQVDLKAAPPGAALFTELYWEPVNDADGYKVYRSFDSKNFDLISYIDKSKSYLEDFSPKLAVGKTVYYRIIPYNSSGDGEYIERAITPLPAISVFLVSPANQARDISLSPIFKWRINSSSLFPAEAVTFSNLSIYDGTAYFLGDYEVINGEEYTLAISLAPGNVYSWDIVDTGALMPYYDDIDGVSYAYSFAGSETSSASGSGSINGEFIFTTTTKID